VISDADRNRKVTFERQGPRTDDGYTTQPGEWEPYCTEWAAVTFGTGQERRAAAQEQASQTATFQVLRNAKTAALLPTDRINLDGQFYDITSIVPSKDWNAGVDVTAVWSA
jgi:SPP1 family predicted phage head-tail adaptor